MIEISKTKKFTLAIIVLFLLYLLSPYLSAVGMGAVFAVLFYPWMKRIDRGRFPNSIAAGLFTLAVTLGIFLPVTTVMIGSVKSGLTELKRIKRMNPAPTEAASSEAVLDTMFANSGFDAFLKRTSNVLPVDPVQVSETLKDLIANLTVRVGETLSSFIGRMPSMVVAFAVFLFSMFYFLADGELFLRAVRRKPYFSEAGAEKLFTTFSGLCRSVILASVVSGGLQALLATIVSFAVGMRQSLLVFPLVFVASFVPLIGSFPVVIGLALHQFFTGHTIAGLVVAVSSVIIASCDNVIRPQIIRGGSNLHPLLGFVSALGGLELFGMSGVFLGPVLCGMLVETVKVIQESD